MMNIDFKDKFQKFASKYPVLFFPVMGYSALIVIAIIAVIKKIYWTGANFVDNILINIGSTLIVFSVSYNIFLLLKKVIPASMRDKNLSDFALELGIDKRRLADIKKILTKNEFIQLRNVGQLEYSLDDLLLEAKISSEYKAAIISEKNNEAASYEEDYDLRSILTNHKFTITAVRYLYDLILKNKKENSYDYIAANREGSIVLAYFISLLLQKPLLLITESEKFKKIKPNDMISYPSDAFIDVHISGFYEKNKNKKAILINDSISGGSNIKKAAEILKNEGIISTDLFLIFIKGNRERLEYAKNSSLKIHACRRQNESNRKSILGIDENDKRHIRLILTENCNLNCSFCHKEGIYVEKPKRNVSNCRIHNAIPDYRMQTDIGYFEKLSCKLKENFPKVKKIVLTGGEPLLNPCCAQIIKILKNKNFSVHLTTNGVFLDEETLNELLIAGVDCINISIYSNNPEEYARFHGSTEKVCRTVLDNINNINQEICEKIKINLIFQKGDLTISTQRDVYKNILSKFDFFSNLSSNKKLKISFISQLDSDKPKEMKNFIDLINGDENMQQKWPLIEQNVSKGNVKITYKYGKNPQRPATWEFDPLPITSELESCKLCPEKLNCIEGPYAFRIRTTQNGCEVYPCLIIDNNKKNLVFD